MTIAEMQNVQRLREAPADELRAAWLRLNQWYAQFTSGEADFNKEELINAALLVMGEMHRRGMGFDENLPIAREARAWAQSVKIQNLPEEVTVIRNFASLVGSFVKKPESARDVDVLIRSYVDWDKWEVRIPFAHIWLPIRNAFGKETPLHLITSPHGPHGEDVPLYDLVLRKVNDLSFFKRVKPKKVILGWPSSGIVPEIRIYGSFKDIVDDMLAITPHHKTYVEPFAGGASIFFAKAKSDVEVLNDIDPRVIKALRWLRDASPLEIDKMRKRDWMGKDSIIREAYNILYETDKWKKLSGADLFYYFMYFHKLRFMMRSNRAFKRRVKRLVENLHVYKHRLKDTILHCGDYRTVIDKYDSKDTFFFLDPPWVKRGCYGYEKDGWEMPTYKEILDKMAGIKGMFLMHYGYYPEVAKYAKSLGLEVRIARMIRASVDGLIRSSIEARKTKGEEDEIEKGRRVVKLLCIANYELPSRIQKTRVIFDFAEGSYGEGKDSEKQVVELGGGYTDKPGILNLDKVNGHDLENGIPLPADSVTLIYASHCLEHLSNQHFIMSEIHRVLEPGGYAIIVVPSTLGLGAFAHPDHKTYWNSASFEFWTNPKLLEGRPRFEKVYIGDHVRGPGAVDTVAILRKPDKVEKAFSPFTPFDPPKPAMAGYTEAFSYDDLKDWVRERIENGIAVEVKYNGFRAIAERKGDQIRLWFEDTPGKDRIASLPDDLKSALMKVDGDWIVDLDLGLETKDGKRLDRVKLMVFNSGDPKKEIEANGYKIVATIFDIVYWDEDLSQLPLEERREFVEEFVEEANSDAVRASEIWYAYTEEELQDAIKQAVSVDKSEGAMLKDLSSPYKTGGISDWAKLKLVAEVKVQVIEVERTDAGTYKYRVGILPGTLDYLANIGDSGLVETGWTHAVGFKAKPGDILTLRVREVLLDQNKQTLTFVNAMPVDIDGTRSKPYSAAQVMDIAERSQTLVIKAADEEGGDETRAEAAEEAWNKTWIAQLPTSGKGRFVYHHHWRGLEEDEIDLSDDELMKTGHSVHGDLRLEGDEALWGWAVLIGSTKDNRKMDKLISMSKTGEPSNIRLANKLPQPKPWLDVGIRKPKVSPPGDIGSTSQKWSKFFAIDHGTYELGVATEHFVEIFLNGEQLKGRFVLQAIPVEGGKRVWNITKPADQNPSLLTLNIREKVADQRKKKREGIVLSAPGYKPVFIVFDSMDEKEIEDAIQRAEAIQEELKSKLKKSMHARILKADQEKRIVTGIVLEPNLTEDGQPIGLPDFQGDRYKASEIENACYEFMLNGHTIGLMHRERADGCVVVENYIAPNDLVIGEERVRKGSWILSVKVMNDEIWQQIKAGKIRGFSIGAYGRRSEIQG